MNKGTRKRRFLEKAKPMSQGFEDMRVERENKRKKTILLKRNGASWKRGKRKNAKPGG